MRSAFVRGLTEAAAADPSLFLITADMGFSVLEEFQKRFPRQFLNAGIAEQNAVTFGAGLASQGYNVFVYSIIPFITMRCFEQVRVDVAYSKARLKLVGVGAGLSYGPAGATHHSLEDISIMRSLPGMTVLCPGDPVEAEALVKQAAQLQGPCYLRLGKNGDPLVHDPSRHIELGKISQVVNDGNDYLILSTSNTLALAHEATKKLKTLHSLSGRLVSLHTLKPLDRSGIKELLKSTGGPVLSVEEHGPYGGLNSALCEFMQEEKILRPLLRISLPDEYSHKVGSQDYLRREFSITSEAIEKAIVGFKN